MTQTRRLHVLMPGLAEITPSVSFLTVAEAECSPDLQAAWEGLLETRSHLFAGYQSLAWLGHLQRGLACGEELRIAVLRSAGSVVGITSLRIGRLALAHRLKLFPRSGAMMTAQVVGHQPLMPDSAPLFDCLLAGIHQEFPECDCVYLRMLPLDSFALRHLSRQASVGRRFIYYAPADETRTHAIRLPGSFDEYVARFNPKHRSTLRRKLRLLREHGQGSLELKRYESPADVDEFLGHTQALVRKTWQFQVSAWLLQNQAGSHAELTDLATQGWLRSYVLHCGGRPCAYVYGYQLGDVYYYDQPGFDQDLARFSPGTSLLYLLIEDLLRHRPPRLVSFGFGDAGYKRAFADTHSDDAVVYLLRRNWRNRIRVAAHAGAWALWNRWKRFRRSRSVNQAATASD